MQNLRMALQRSGSVFDTSEMVAKWGVVSKLECAQDKPIHSRVLGLPDGDPCWSSPVRKDAAKAVVTAAWRCIFRKCMPLWHVAAAHSAACLVPGMHRPGVGCVKSWYA